MNWSLTHGGSSRLDLGSLICLTAKKVIAPNLSLLDKLFVFDAVLIEHVVISARQESAFVVEDLKTPSFTVEMGDIDNLFAGSIGVDNLNSSIVVAYQNSTIEKVD